MRHLVLIVLLLVVSAAAVLPVLSDADTGPAPAVLGALAVPRSYVIGSGSRAQGGELVVGLLLPSRDDLLVKAVIGEEAYERFVAREAAIEVSGQEPVEADELNEFAGGEFLAGWHWSRRKEVHDDAWRLRNDVRKALDEAVYRLCGVHVQLREVMADECAHVPLVLLAPRTLPASERNALATYQAGGGRIVRAEGTSSGSGEVLPGLFFEKFYPRKDSVDVLAQACVEAVRSSTLLARLPSDPREGLTSTRDGAEVVLHFPQAPAAVSVRDLSGKVVGAATPACEVRLHCPAAVARPFFHRLHVEWQREGITLRRTWSFSDFAEDVDRQVLAASQAYAGGTYAVRVIYTHAESGTPAIGQREEIRFLQAGHVLASCEKPSGASGSLDVRLPVPLSAESGPAELQVGEDRFPVSIERKVRISLVTDRTLYKQTDRVQARVMVHAVPTGSPAKGVTVTLRLGKSRQDVTTSAFGIASGSFALLEAKAGPLTVSARVGLASTTATLRVEAFEKPTFRLELTPSLLELDRGQSGTIQVQATTLTGKPLVGASVRFDSNGPYELDRTKATTDADGRAEVTLRAGRTPKGAPVAISVVDVDGRRITRMVAVVSGRARRVIRIRPIADLVVGERGRFQIDAPGRDVLEVRVDGHAPIQVALDASGRGAFEAVPRAGEVSVTGPHLTSRAFVAYVPDVSSLRPVLLLDRRLATVGESFPVQIRGQDGAVFVDVMRDGSLVRTLSTVVTGGKGQLNIPLTPDIAGMLEVRAYRIIKDKPLGTVARVLVLRGRNLSVEAKPRAATYRPGETAQVDVRVSDAAGRPTAGVVGYWAVDQALLDLSPWGDGKETVFDLVDGQRQSRLLGLAHGAPDAVSARALLGPVRDRDDGGVYKVRHRRLEVRKREAAEAATGFARERLQALRAAVAKALAAVPLEEIRFTVSLRETLAWLLQRGGFDPQLLLDPWGTPVVLRNTRTWTRLHTGDRNAWSWSAHLGYPCVSAGPDLQPGTADDIRLPWSQYSWRDDEDTRLPGRLRRFLRLAVRQLRKPGRAQRFGFEGILDVPFEGPVSNGVIGIGGGAGGSFGGRGGGRDLGVGAGGRKSYSFPAERMRKDFPPTLCFVPEAIVGPDGTALLEVDLADSVTTWRTRLVASATDGATGIGFTEIRVELPLEALPWIAPRLTDGDVLELPVAVRNGTDAAMDTKLELVVSGPLEVIGTSTATVPVPARASGAHRFTLRAKGTGRGTVVVRVSAGLHNDAVERTVMVRPNARRVVETVAKALRAGRVWQPTLGAGREGPLEVEVYPSALADTVSGFDGLIRKPGGCFEQTSSTLYPMVLALAYMQRTGQTNAALDRRARALIAGGYERLLGFEVAGTPGGFSLFGKAPASTFLSAYGLMEFADMASVHQPDAALMPRIVKFLRSRQREDGSWKPGRFAHQELWAEGQHPAFNATAYTAWALAKVGEPATKALGWLAAQVGAVESTYSLTLGALAFLQADRESKVGRGILRRLRAAAETDDEGIRWRSASPTGLGARGRVADIETSALAIQALLLEGGAPRVVEGGLARLITLRSADGRFGTTQSTILALQALLTAEAEAAQGGEATLRIFDGERELVRQPFAADASEPVHLDLGLLDPGTLRIEVDGTRRLRANVTRVSLAGWDEGVPDGGRVGLKVRYPQEALEIGRPAFATVELHNRSKHKASLVTAEIGVPPGCDIDPRLVKAKGVQRVERSKDAVVLYLLDMKPGARLLLKLPFVPRHGLDVQTTPSRAYEYYVPHETTIVPPQRVRTR